MHRPCTEREDTPTVEIQKGKIPQPFISVQYEMYPTKLRRSMEEQQHAIRGSESLLFTKGVFLIKPEPRGCVLVSATSQ